MQIFEFGYFFFVYVTVNTAAREAARYGAGAGENVSASAPYYQDCDGIREVAVRIGRYANLLAGDVTIEYDNGPTDTTPNGTCINSVGTYDPALGERIVVRVAVEYRPIILFGSRTRTDALTTIRAESARTIIKRLQVGG